MKSRMRITITTPRGTFTGLLMTRQEAKEKGLDHAAAALEHYLSGKGTPFKIDKEWFRSYDSVIEAEEINIRRFFGRNIS